MSEERNALDELIEEATAENPAWFKPGTDVEAHFRRLLHGRMARWPAQSWAIPSLAGVKLSSGSATRRPRSWT